MQGRGTPPAPPGLDRHEGIDLLRRQQHPLLALMPGLPARAPAGGGPFGRPVDGGRIRRGRAGRVLRTLAQALLQFGHPGQQVLDYLECLGQRRRAQVGWEWRHTTTCMLLTPKTHYIFDSPSSS